VKIFTLVFVVLFLQAITYAAPYNATMGPYAVSFDMGFSNYYTTEEPWKSSESLSGDENYEFGSINVYKNRDHDDGIAIISIKRSDMDQIVLSPSESAEVLKESGYTTATRMIDGVLGFIASQELGNGITIYMAHYKPAIDPAKLNVSIISNYPWDSGTLLLLKTIHIEEKTAKDSEMMEQTTSTDLSFKVLIDNETEQVITTNNPLKLAEDYVLQISHIDVDGNKVYLDLLKNNKVVDSKTVSPSKDNPTEEDKIYRYKKDIRNSKNVTLIEINFKNAFRGSDQDLGTITSVKQISESPM
jgi:hypothetical protein